MLESIRDCVQHRPCKIDHSRTRGFSRIWLVRALIRVDMHVERVALAMNCFRYREIVHSLQSILLHLRFTRLIIFDSTRVSPRVQFFFGCHNRSFFFEISFVRSSINDPFIPSILE